MIFASDKEPSLVKQFERVLAQTIFWCSSRADANNPRDCLRTPEFRPRVFEKSRVSAVETVTAERERFGGVEMRKAQIPRNFGGGRLLAYLPDANFCCGASEQETKGFFDADNVPAWDTWITYIENGSSDFSYGYLISWIPPEFVGLVSEGIHVNPEECILWLSDAELSFAKTLRREGLLF